jgi:hypothetical protein
MSDWDQVEYQALMARGRDAERIGSFCWTAAGLTGAVLMCTAIAAKNATLMLPVIFAAAYGFYAAIRARHQVRLIAGYVKQFMEPGSGPNWFTRLEQVEDIPGFNPPGDWAATAISNVLVVTAMAFSWMYASTTTRGDLMAGIATAVGLIFAFHSIVETARLRQTSASSLWNQVVSNAEERRGPRLASRS